jgi:hypothetical protein
MLETAAKVAGIAQAAGDVFSAFGGSGGEVDWLGAKKGIRWRVKDAKLAGVHPLYALGAPGVGSGVLTPKSGSTAGAALSAAGQAIQNYTDEADHKARQLDAPKEKALKTHNAVQEARINESNADRARYEAKLIEMQYQDSVMARDAQTAHAAQGQNLTEIPWDHQAVRDFRTGEIYALPNHKVGIEIPEAYGGLKLIEPYRLDPSTWHGDFRGQYK